MPQDSSLHVSNYDAIWRTKTNTLCIDKLDLDWCFVNFFSSALMAVTTKCELVCFVWTMWIIGINRNGVVHSMDSVTINCIIISNFVESLDAVQGDFCRDSNAHLSLSGLPGSSFESREFTHFLLILITYMHIVCIYILWLVAYGLDNKEHCKHRSENVALVGVKT